MDMCHDGHESEDVPDWFIIDHHEDHDWTSFVTHTGRTLTVEEVHHNQMNLIESMMSPEEWEAEVHAMDNFYSEPYSWGDSIDNLIEDYNDDD